MYPLLAVNPYIQRNRCPVTKIICSALNIIFSSTSYEIKEVDFVARKPASGLMRVDIIIDGKSSPMFWVSDKKPVFREITRWLEKAAAYNSFAHHNTEFITIDSTTHVCTIALCDNGWILDGHERCSSSELESCSILVVHQDRKKKVNVIVACNTLKTISKLYECIYAAIHHYDCSFNCYKTWQMNYLLLDGYETGMRASEWISLQTDSPTLSKIGRLYLQDE